MTARSGALPDWLAHRAAASPSHTALVAAGRSWSFPQLDAAASRFARQLAMLGVAPGSRVATLLPNVPEAVILVHATLRAGATLVPLNVRASASELAWLLSDASPQLLVVEQRTIALWQEVRRALASRGDEIAVVSVDDAFDAEVEPPQPESVAESAVKLRLMHGESDVAAILYTSGTAGRPKGVMLTVGNFWWNAIGSALNLGAHADDRWLACLPLFHVGGLAIVTRAAICGLTIVLHDGFDAAAVNRAIDDDRITIVSVVGAMLHRMLEERGDRAYPPWLRCVLLGGGPAQRALLERCSRAGVPVATTYGLTEATSQVATRPPATAISKLESVGRPLYPNAVRIVAEGGREAEAGEAGTILVCGPIVMAGYAGRPDATARAIQDGWLHTGDVGYLDVDGELHVLDRRDDLIVSGGENVYPAEVEAVLLAHPSVAEAAVLGVPSEAWGARVLAVVRLSDGEARPSHEVVAALRAHCRTHLAGYKTPDEVRIVTDPLPRTASGKLRRAALRDIVLSR